MATISQSIFITKKEKLHCAQCKKPIKKGEAFIAESELAKGTCFSCSPFTRCVLLPPGNAALTRRSKKHSSICGVVFSWNQRRKRYERMGQYVDAGAITLAIKECDEDEEKRAAKNIKAALVREIEDKVYIQEFGKAIRLRYPRCPKLREFAIAAHACEKYSGRVGRSASAKKFDAQMIDLAVEAHIRHVETDYDFQFGKGKSKKEIRAEMGFTIRRILSSWR
jgi:predicted nucleic acid-binding Zn ribbon protein